MYLQRRWAEAQMNLKQAIALKADHARAHTNLAMVLARNEAADEALAEFRKAGCDEATAQANLAFVLLTDHHFDEARDHYQKALASNPRSERAKAGLKDLDNVVAKLNAPRPEKKVQTASAAAPKAEPKSPPARPAAVPAVAKTEPAKAVPVLRETKAVAAGPKATPAQAVESPESPKALTALPKAIEMQRPSASVQRPLLPQALERNVVPEAAPAVQQAVAKAVPEGTDPLAVPAVVPPQLPPADAKGELVPASLEVKEPLPAVRKPVLDVEPVKPAEDKAPEPAQETEASPWRSAKPLRAAPAAQP
jgi:tetratricopeptide (TPR) repeat protein